MFRENVLPAWHHEDVEIYPDLNVQIALRLDSDARHFKSTVFLLHAENLPVTTVASAAPFHKTICQIYVTEPFPKSYGLEEGIALIILCKYEL